MEQVFKPNFLNGQVAIITGGATGICYGISEAYLKYGAKVCVTSRKVEVLEKASIELAKSSGNPNVIYFPCDIRDFKQVEKMVDFVLEKWGRVDILVNGAAGNFLVPFEQMSPNAFKTVLEIDTVGTFHVDTSITNYSVVRQSSRNSSQKMVDSYSTSVQHSPTRELRCNLMQALLSLLWTL
jgi:peroxisomal 2,4-dienoyl-CoA reductase